jgi:DNA-binding transcriptional LysR family regulator
MGLAELQPAGMLHFSSYDQLISAALAGQGIALGRMPLIASHLKSRKLVAPFSDSVVSPRSYYMIVAPASAARPEIRAFTDWLVASAAATTPARGPDSARRRGRAPA